MNEYTFLALIGSGTDELKAKLIIEAESEDAARTKLTEALNQFTSGGFFDFSLLNTGETPSQYAKRVMG